MISWHGGDRILSIDVHPSGRIATAGQDGTIRIWKVDRSVQDEASESQVVFLSELRGPTDSLAVNCVRFAPVGLCLASGGDGTSRAGTWYCGCRHILRL